MYCAVKNGKAFIGSKQEILAQVCEFGFSETRQLHAKFLGHETKIYHSYDEKYRYEEIFNDAVVFLFSKLTQHNFLIFREY